jgi:cytochrome c oxidase cbb3-type subunit III
MRFELPRRISPRFVPMALLAALTALLSACAHAPGYPPAPVARPSDVTDFDSLYSANCASCHGANGQGGPAVALANPKYQALVDDASLRKWIANGMPGTEMPAFAQSAGGMLTDAQVNAIISGMRREWSRHNAFAGAAPPPYAQTNSGDPHRGQQNYQSRCASCHASSPQQITSPVYLALVGDQALRTVIIAGRPDIGQPDFAHLGPGGTPAAQLSPQDVDDIVSYLASLRTPSSQAADAAQQQSTPPAGAR